jgi:hypothetical protein
MVGSWLPSSAVLPNLEHLSVQMYFWALFERVWRCTSRPRLSELRDALGGRNQMNLEMH